MLNIGFYLVIWYDIGKKRKKQSTAVRQLLMYRKTFDTLLSESVRVLSILLRHHIFLIPLFFHEKKNQTEPFLSPVNDSLLPNSCHSALASTAENNIMFRVWLQRELFV